jgi:hypothetical protein
MLQIYNDLVSKIETLDLVLEVDRGCVRRLERPTSARTIKTSSRPNHLMVTSLVYSRNVTTIIHSAINTELTMSKAGPLVTGSV